MMAQTKTKKLHIHLGLESGFKGAFYKMQAETVSVFKDHDQVKGLVKEYTPKDEGGEPLAREEKKCVTCVRERLNWTRESAIALLDYELTKDTANQEATADLVVDGEVLATSVPVTTLLSLEKRLQEIRGVYNIIPTLDMSKDWQLIEGGEGYYKHGPVKQYRTAKKTTPVVLYAATKEHPAQVKEVVEDVTIGTFETTHISGASTASIKARLMERIDKLIMAVDSARRYANESEVKDRSIGRALFNYVHG
jgi:hypothetical protein